MHKLRLDPEALTVESFAPAGGRGGEGTVQGHGGESVWQVCEPQIPDDSINYCGPAITQAGCGTVTQANTCGCASGRATCGGYNTCGAWTCNPNQGWTCSELFIPEEL